MERWQYISTGVLTEPLLKVVWTFGNCQPDGLRAGHVKCQGDEMALHARRDVEGPCCGIHAGHILRVGHLLHHHLHLQCRGQGSITAAESMTAGNFLFLI